MYDVKRRLSSLFTGSDGYVDADALEGFGGTLHLHGVSARRLAKVRAWDKQDFHLHSHRHGFCAFLGEGGGGIPARQQALMQELRLPQFIIAGAPRSGTTWLYTIADRHPEIAMAKPVRPEPKFFLRDDLYEKGLRYYSTTWFAPLPANRILGEKSANYLENAQAAQRIAHDLPGVRLVFVLRNPVERAYSNFLFSTESGLETESFERALELEDERTHTLPTHLRFTRPFSYFARGLYAQMLAPWLSRFDRSQILVLRTEHIAKRPEDAAARLQQFLGVRAEPNLHEIGVANATMAGSPMRAATWEMLARRYQQPNRDLAAMLGEDFSSWG